MIDTWLRDLQTIPMRDEASVSLAREAVRAEGARAQMPPAAIAALATAASELGHNQLAHARGGMFATRGLARGGVLGVEVICADRGDGIAEPARALKGRSAAPAGLGIGLAGVRALADEVDFDVRLGEGTCVWARKFASPVRRQREIGVYGRAHPVERVCGDHAAFVRTGDTLHLALSDGLGHGPDARVASRAAVLRFEKGPTRPLEDVLAEADEALTSTRGAVMGLARIDEAGLLTATVGNIVTYVCGPGGVTRRFSGTSAVLGIRGRSRPVLIESMPLNSHDAVLIYSDGIVQRASLDGALDLLREHPLIIAERMVRTFAREDDDVLVLVAR